MKAITFHGVGDVRMQEVAGGSFFRSSSRIRGRRPTTDSPWICSTMSPFRSITIVYGEPLKPNELPMLSFGSTATG